METRKTPRVDVNVKAVSKISENHEQNIHLADGNSFEAKTCDINILGLGLIVKYFLPKGVVLDIELDGAPFGVSKNLQIKAEVCHCKNDKSGKYKCGMRFVNISEEDRQSIAKFIETYEKRKIPRLQLPEE